MKKVLYVHGYAGAENGNAARLLVETLNERNLDVIVDAPAIPYLEPEKAVELIMNKQFDYDIIVASSLGAFYAMQTFGKPKILVNIAMPNDLYKVADSFKAGYIEKLLEQKDHYFNMCIDLEALKETHFIFGTEDKIANNKNFIIENYGNEYVSDIDMQHKLDKTGAEKICDVIEKYFK